MNLSDNAIHTLNQRYLRKDGSGVVIETPEQLMERVSKICKDEGRQKRILQYLLNLDFLPNSPTLMNAGTELGMLSACFVLPIDDSIEGIFDAVKYTALIHKSGGGTGFNFSHLRPEGYIVKSTQGQASGPLSFMECFNASTNVIAQAGKRRGANMGILNDSHPDVLKFISAKNKGDTLKNFNLSVAVTDEFMQCVKDNKDWNLMWKGKVMKTVKARDVFTQIVENAHDHGDPGLIFIDEINRNNNGEKIESTNPCGEQPLLPYESCNLASINLVNMINKSSNSFDFEKLDNLIQDLVPFMDDVIDVNKFPIPQIREATLKTRKIGIGVMGWADSLIRMGIPYGSTESLILAESVMKFIGETCHKVSNGLNGNLTTIAPTGTISIIANVSSGIEPLFAVVYKRELKNTIGKDMFEIDKNFLKISKERGFYSESLMNKIVSNHGSVKGIKEIPEDIQQLFITAHDISYQKHIEMQSSFQKYTDSACSKTINMSNSATKDDIWNAYFLSWESKCKGITIYRDGSKDKQILVAGESLKDVPTPRPRFKDHLAVIREIKTACGIFYDTIGVDEYGIFENFQINSKKGGCDASQKALGRATSMSLRHNVPVSTIIKQFHRVDCNSSIIKKNEGKIDIMSCADGVSKHLSDYYENKEILSRMVELQKLIHTKFNVNGKTEDNLLKDSKSIEVRTKKCPQCGGVVDNTSCGTCLSCGYSKCL